MSKNNALDRLANLRKHLVQPPMGTIDLTRERENSSFDVQKMNWLFEGGKEKAKAMADAYQIIQRDPDLHFPNGHPFDMTRPEQREFVMRQILRYQKVRQTIKDPLLYKALELAMCTYSETFSMRIYVHDTLFRQAFELFGTKEQYDRWIDDIRNWRVIGCFAMTELCHSSFLRGLETTATYDRETDEFVIHSPTLGATKVWIGMAGQTATHTVAICKTIIDGKDHGINWFVVQLRDCKTGRLVPGVVAGDIGAKYGRNGLDNGWIQFSHIRIPRENMLMKWSKVSKDGTYTPSPNPALSYATLIGERLSVLFGTQIVIGQALTIACRYGCVRRQGADDEKIMDYQTHYVKLMPGVASVYVINLLYRIILNRWESTLNLVHTNQSEFIKRIGDFHATSTGLKGTLTWWGSEVLERVRRSMGGHAYSAYNAIGPAIGDWGVVTTGGGDNFVLLQQTAKYVLGALKDVSQGKRVDGSVAYLNDLKIFSEISKSNLSDERQLSDLDFTLELFTWLVVQKLQHLAVTLSTSSSDPATSWNSNQMLIIKLAQLHTYRLTLFEYNIGLKDLSDPSSKSGFQPNEYRDLVPILKKMGQLWSVHLINEYLDLFLEEGYFNKEHARMVRKVYLEMCKETRKEVIPLVDAWGYPDFVLKAPFGRYDGDIYTAYIDTIKAAPNCLGVPNYWKDYIKPLTNPDS
ncbi:4540_t:CDS:10, partial [Acaulospora morrowiae]